MTDNGRLCRRLATYVKRLLGQGVAATRAADSLRVEVRTSMDNVLDELVEFGQPTTTRCFVSTNGIIGAPRL